MWVTKRTDYATRVLLALALDQSDRLLTLNDLAARTSTPRSTVDQVMSRLREGGLVQAARGPFGGYRLNRSPADITVEEVLRLFQGNVTPLECTQDDPSALCEMAVGCSLRELWSRAHAAVVEVLGEVTLADLAASASGTWVGERPVTVRGDVR